MDVYSLLSIVKSYYQVDNYDLHRKLQVASKKYYEFTKDLNIDEYFDVETCKAFYGNGLVHYVCGRRHNSCGPVEIYYYPDGTIKEKIYLILGILHRHRTYGQKPTYIKYYTNGNIQTKLYHRYDLLHREDGPAHIKYYPDGNIKSEHYYIDNIPHRENGPAKILYKGVRIRRLEYYINGDIHREDGPAIEEWVPSYNILLKKSYYINGRLHREDGPAKILLYNNSSDAYHAYYINGKRHRDDGPAVIQYSRDYYILQEWYYKKGKLYREDGPEHVIYPMYKEITALLD